MKFKKPLILVLLLCLISVTTAFIFTACDNKDSFGKIILNSGEAGDNISWTYYNDNTLEFNGFGDMYEYYDDYWYDSRDPMEMPWYEYAKLAKEILISDQITSICRFAFFGTRGIKKIDIPNSVTYIGACAFEYSVIEKLVLPEKIDKINEYSFSHCHKLKAINLNSNIKEISEGAFDDCTSLKAVYYDGNSEQWKNINIVDYGNYNLNAATLYYFSEEYPFNSEVTEGNFWHYVDDEIVVWTKED